MFRRRSGRLSLVAADASPPCQGCGPGLVIPTQRWRGLLVRWPFAGKVVGSAQPRPSCPPSPAAAARVSSGGTLVARPALSNSSRSLSRSRIGGLPARFRAAQERLAGLGGGDGRCRAVLALGGKPPAKAPMSRRCGASSNSAASSSGSVACLFTCPYRAARAPRWANANSPCAGNLGRAASGLRQRSLRHRGCGRAWPGRMRVRREVFDD